MKYSFYLFQLSKFRCSSKSSSCAKRKSRRKRRSRNCSLEKCDSEAIKKKKNKNKISNGGIEMKDKKCAPIAEITDGGGADSQSSLSDKELTVEEQLIWLDDRNNFCQALIFPPNYIVILSATVIFDTNNFLYLFLNFWKCRIIYALYIIPRAIYSTH